MAARICSIFNHSVKKPRILLRCSYCTKEKVEDAFNKSLLDILVCPLSKEKLRYDSESNELINDNLKVAYPIVNGIPNMNPTNARKIEDNKSGE